MFKNVGKEIKNIAEVIFVLFIIASGMIAISVFSFSENIIAAVIVFAVGCVAGRCTSVCLYGFGELISETAANREATARLVDILESQFGYEHSNPGAAYTPPNWICKKCGAENDHDIQFCRMCGRPVWDEKKTTSK